MNHFTRNKDQLSSRLPASPSLKKLHLLPAIIGGVALSLCSCKDESSPPPPQVVVETKDVGNGLGIIGFAILGASVVVVLGRLLR